MKTENIGKEKKFKELSEEELKLVTGGKEPFPESQVACENPEYKQYHLDECTVGLSATAEDSK